MLLDKFVFLEVKSSRIIAELNKINIHSKIGDRIQLNINKLWKKSNIIVKVKCDVCDLEKFISFASYNKNYSKYNVYCCSNKCAMIKNRLTKLEKYGDENYSNPNKSKETKLKKYGDKNYVNHYKIKQTNLLKHGDENFNNRIKYTKTCLDKYGVNNSFQIEDVKEKIKQTNLEKYGIKDSRKSNIIKDKRIKTMIERYGVDNYSKTEEFKNKVRETAIIKHGVDSPNKSKIIKDKKIESMLNKYGYISNSMTIESKEKLKKTNLEKYGVEYPMQVEEFAIKQQKNSFKINYYKNIPYQGSYEKDFLEFMENNNLLNEVVRGNFIKYEFDDKIKIYYPDFYIEKYNLIIEIKSSYYYNKFLEKNIAKMDKSIEVGYNYLFIINKNYDVLLNIFNIY